MVRIGGHHEALPWLHTQVFAAHQPLDPFPTEVFALGFEILMDPGTAVGFLGCGADRLDPDAQGAVGAVVVVVLSMGAHPSGGFPPIRESGKPGEDHIQ